MSPLSPNGMGQKSKSFNDLQSKANLERKEQIKSPRKDNTSVKRVGSYESLQSLRKQAEANQLASQNRNRLSQTHDRIDEKSETITPTPHRSSQTDADKSRTNTSSSHTDADKSRTNTSSSTDNSKGYFGGSSWFQWTPSKEDGK